MSRFLLPPSIDEWLPERNLVRFVVEVIDGLDLTAMSKTYRGTGSASYHPAPLLGLLVYGYATGVFSSRKLERATHDSVAFRSIAANDHPDHDTIATFRRRFLNEIEILFVKRFAGDPLPPDDPTPVEAMAHRLKTREGRDLYALRKQIPGPVFGIIKSVMGFRQFLLRGIDKVRGEWSLVTMDWNVKRMFVLCPGQ
jgi:hypothetical protein